MATETSIPPQPTVATQKDWLVARKKLLAEEKELTRQGDRIAAHRRRLPMVKVGKNYVFQSPQGKRSLADLFDGRDQLIIYHFMFDPEWEKGCPGCTGYVNALGDLSLLNERKTTLVLISRAPLSKLEAYRQKNGWTLPWYSSFGSDFNYDYHVTRDEKVTPAEYNYRAVADMKATGTDNQLKGESHGLSVFFRTGQDVFHTYSSYARGVESLTDAYSLLDTTPYGRQEDWEDSPAGWPQKPTYGG